MSNPEDDTVSFSQLLSSLHNAPLESQTEHINRIMNEEPHAPFESFEGLTSVVNSSCSDSDSLREAPPQAGTSTVCSTNAPPPELTDEEVKTLEAVQEKLKQRNDCKGLFFQW